MSQSLVQIYVHLVFSTKHRQPLLRKLAFRERTYAYLVGICNNQDSPSLRVGGVEDHVHILCRLSKTLDVAALVRELSRRTRPNGSKPKTRSSPISNGRKATVRSRSARPTSNRCPTTSPTRSTVIDASRSKTNSAACARNTASRSTNVTCGIDATMALFRPIFFVRSHNPAGVALQSPGSPARRRTLGDVAVSRHTRGHQSATNPRYAAGVTQRPTIPPTRLSNARPATRNPNSTAQNARPHPKSPSQNSKSFPPRKILGYLGDTASARLTSASSVESSSPKSASVSHGYPLQRSPGGDFPTNSVCKLKFEGSTGKASGTQICLAKS